MVNIGVYSEIDCFTFEVHSHSPISLNGTRLCAVNTIDCCFYYCTCIKLFLLLAADVKNVMFGFNYLFVFIFFCVSYED